MADHRRFATRTASLNETWTSRAACRDLSMFMTTLHETATQRESREGLAKCICAECPVESDCAAYALRVREPLGVWGGMNPSERLSALERRPQILR